MEQENRISICLWMATTHLAFDSQVYESARIAFGVKSFREKGRHFRDTKMVGLIATCTCAVISFAGKYEHYTNVMDVSESNFSDTDS